MFFRQLESAFSIAAAWIKDNFVSVDLCRKSELSHMVTLIIQKLAGYMKNAQKNTTLSYRYKVDINHK